MSRSKYLIALIIGLGLSVTPQAQTSSLPDDPALMFSSSIPDIPGEAAKRRPSSRRDQDTVDITGWRYGLNIGFYFGNRESAGFYSGAETNENKLSYVLNNKYRYDELRQLINFADTMILLETPSRMTYDPAVMVGFLAKYNFSNTMGFFFQFNYVKLRTSDFFTMEIDPQPFLTEPDIRLYGIVGQEERVNVEIGVSRYIPLSPKTRLFLEGGLNINDSEVKSHDIQIEGRTYSLINVYGSQTYVPNTSLQSYEIRQGGIGFGAFFTGGVQLSFNDNLSLDPGLSLWWKRINLAGYDAYTPHWAITVRFLFKDLGSF